MIATRRLLLLGAASSVAGCGFHPVYGPLAKGGTVSPELASIYVAVMPERQGQLLRQALERRLEGTGLGEAKQYELTGGLAIAIEGLGIQQDTSTTRLRITASSDWVLHKLDPTATVVTSGRARVLDGVNVNDQQYFAQDLETSAAFRRCAETIADQITLDLAVYFRTHPATA